jgi:hypothetical protein
LGKKIKQMKTHIIWFLVAIAALIAGKQLTSSDVRIVEKPVESVKTKEVFVDRPVEVIKEVTKEVEKIVEVPAKIPELYQNSLAFMERVRASKLVTSKESLAGIDAVSVAIFLSDDVKKIVSESEIRTKFEITLRRSGVTIDEKAVNTLSFSHWGFTRDSAILTYSFITSLDDLAYAFRKDGVIIKSFMSTWREGNYGTVGIAKARDALIGDAESSAEAFANEWLAANPKK